MRKVLCFLICLLFAAGSCAAGSLEDPEVGKLRREAQAQYTELSKQADTLLREPVTAPEPPSSSVSCADNDKKEADSRRLTDFIDAFRAPEGPLRDAMLDVQRQLQLMGAQADYTRELALTQRLGQKAQLLIREYGKNIEKIPAIAMATIRTAADIQLLGPDQAGHSGDLMDAVSAMYAAAIEELFRMLTEDHDYAAVQTILDAARASLQLSGASGIDSEALLSRLQNAMRFELTLNYNFEQTGNHRWVEQAVFEVTMAFEEGGIGKVSGAGTGSMLSFVWDDNPDFSVTAPDFPVLAEFENFDPCGAGVELLLTPFHPLSETAHQDGEAIDWPLLKTSWEVSFEQRLQEDGLYCFPLTLRNLEATAVDETLENNMPYNEVKLEVILVHKPSK